MKTPCYFKSALMARVLIAATAIGAETGSEVGKKAPDFTLSGAQLDLKRGTAAEIEVNLYDTVQETEALFLYFYFGSRLEEKW